MRQCYETDNLLTTRFFGLYKNALHFLSCLCIDMVDILRQSHRKRLTYQLAITLQNKHCLPGTYVFFNGRATANYRKFR